MLFFVSRYFGVRARLPTSDELQASSLVGDLFCWNDASGIELEDILKVKLHTHRVATTTLAQVKNQIKVDRAITYRGDDVGMRIVIDHPLNAFKDLH